MKRYGYHRTSTREQHATQDEMQKEMQLLEKLA